ncbi:sulfotransferase family protein [Guptibacillus hwajinpoensis]|uniref:Sulfotransferase domain-containing protein n=1 Tax=Guptibacillus hwajinpoensis TaxID=208199 RepID=A0ABU0JZC4_9BACL|nr:sulfotransferase [Alkalihalobacillus hemicentroti]MDQ0482436.1 hypothetical protein [Alkalihalobacillus hemicentroti]
MNKNNINLSTVTNTDESKWPNLFIVGAAKAGTTSLYSHLQKHPKILMSNIKEPHFFSDINPMKNQQHNIQVASSEKEYLNLFKSNINYQYLGDASPSYLWDKDVPKRIYQKSARSKIIILLRDPIERAYSHYLMDVREGLQKLPFLEAIHEDFAREEKGWGISHLYIELGLYFDQVKRYIDQFGAEEVKILMFEDFKKNPQNTLAGICEFLNIDYDLFVDTSFNENYNSYAAPKNKLAQNIMGNSIIRRASKKFFPKSIREFVRSNLLLKSTEKPLMEPEAKEYLQNIYLEDVCKLEVLLGKKLPSLKKQ